MPIPDNPIEKTVPTSIKLPASVKAQIDESARKAGVSAHAFMVKALADASERARLQEQFHQDSMDALRDMNETGLGYKLDDAHTYFKALALHRQGQGPKPDRPAIIKVN